MGKQKSWQLLARTPLQTLAYADYIASKRYEKPRLNVTENINWTEKNQKKTEYMNISRTNWRGEIKTESYTFWEVESFKYTETTVTKKMREAITSSKKKCTRIKMRIYTAA